MEENLGRGAVYNAHGVEIRLIGTAHISRASISEVSSVIEAVRPALVCVELDEGRYKSMFQKDTWEKLDIIKVFRQGKGFLLLANLTLASFQRRMGEELGVKPGEEMRAACETSQKLGIPYTFCDREVQITLRRAWRKCGFVSKSKLLASLCASAFTTEKLDEQSVENLKKGGELDNMMAELASYMPEIKKTLIDERDEYLAAKIYEAAKGLEAGKSVVAVIGAGHLNGIMKRLEELDAGAENSDVSSLNTVPPPGIGAKIAGAAIPAAIVALIIAGFFRAGSGVSLSMALRWVLWNGSLAALGTLLALGHPLAILVSFLGAPIATINPFIGVGLFSGVTQAWLRKPRVEDAENLAVDAASLKGLYKNRITRALLVFFLSSLGGAIGNFIAIPAIASRLLGAG